MPITVASQKLKAKPGSQDEKAEAIGASRALVRFWMDGSRKPSLHWIDRISDVYDINPNEWEVIPFDAPPPKAKREPKPSAAAPPSTTDEPVAHIDTSDIIGGTKVQLARLAERIEQCTDDRVIVRLEELERSTRHNLSMYLGEGRIITDAVLLRSPAWSRIMSVITKALEPHPAALLDVTEALEAHLGN